MSNFGRRGHKYNLNRSSSSLSSLSDISALQSLAMTPRRPTLKKSTVTLNSLHTMKGEDSRDVVFTIIFLSLEGTPAENNKRVMIIIDGNNTEMSSSISSSSSSSVSSESKDTTDKSES